MPTVLSLDAVVLGGGAAGLWLLDSLHRAGFTTLLLEAHELGSGQTIASQGIIHGGLKYTLSGLFSSAARSISEMPLIWRRCLAGEAAPDLTHTRLRSAYCHLWQTTSLKSRLGMIGARAGLRVTPQKLSVQERPGALASCPGVVARLDEQVIEPTSFLSDLREQHLQRILKIDAHHGLEIEHKTPDGVRVIRLINPETGDAADLAPAVVVLTAGEGNGVLRRQVGLPDGAMQRRPLHMVMVRTDADVPELPMLNAHCVEGAATRVTITTTRDFSDRVVWQVGGQISEQGVDLPAEDLVRAARTELTSLLPDVDFTKASWSTYRVDRAEGAMRGGQRPDEPVILREGNVITAWPTKLALAPRMAAGVLEQVKGLVSPAPGGADRTSVRHVQSDVLSVWPRPVVALAPWEVEQHWFTDV